MVPNFSQVPILEVSENVDLVTLGLRAFPKLVDSKIFGAEDRI
jgi:hypothetical protein